MTARNQSRKTASRLPDGRRRGPLGRRMVGTAEELGLDPAGGKWVVTCEDHSTVVNVDTRAQALATSTMEFCEECGDDGVTPPTCQECGNCIALEGYTLCSDCLPIAHDA